MVRIYLSPVDKVNKPPLRYLQVQDALVLGSGIPWTIAYVLYARQASLDKSYGMPLIPLCANIAWELIYGVIHPNSLGQVISFVPWLIADVPIVYATVKHGPSKWEQAPLVANNLGAILAIGIPMMIAMHLAFRNSCKNLEEGPFWSAWVCQLLISCGSVMHLMCRNETSGHSWGIWACRWVGTLSAIMLFRWRYKHYPKDYSMAAKPMALFIFIVAEAADLIYPFVYASLERKQKVI